jgi:2-hydroxychromene-2-carboxylate isomerase
MPKLDYYLSLNSPWTYLGSARFIGLVDRYAVDVTIKPARFGEVFAHTGGLPVTKRSPQRQAYRMMELRRWLDELEIPIIEQPKYFPADETIGTHAVIAAALAGADALRLSSEIGRAVWEREENIADLDAVMGAAPGTEELDTIWANNTEQAVAAGVFGAPSYVFQDGEIMWGQDRLSFVEKKLSELA